MKKHDGPKEQGAPAANRMTMAELAKRVGVNRTTVSRILRSDFAKHHYNADTIKRVRDEAARLGFRSNRIAQGLKTGKSALVGLLMADIRNPWWGELASQLDRLLAADGYRVIIADSGNSFQRESASLSDLLAFGVDGLLFSPCELKRQPALARADRPVVLLDYDLYPAHPCVSLDTQAAARAFLEAAERRGRKRIGLIAHGATGDLERAFARQGRVLRAPASLRRIESAAAQVDWLLAHEADCLIGLNNALAVAALAHLRVRGPRVPDDVGFAGIDDFMGAPLLTPPLTVLQQPLHEYARCAVELLHRRMADPRARFESVLCQGTLIERCSL